MPSQGHIKESFLEIPGFRLYAVSNLGRVLNLKTNRIMVQSPTQYGDPTVGLVKNGIQKRRSVKVLVAKAWVHGESLAFNTVINKDGDRMNNRISNLAWRPRWFAWKYHQQFQHIPAWVHHGPVYDVRTGDVYEDIYHAAIENGAFFEDVRTSITYGTRVFPEGGIYKFTE